MKKDFIEFLGHKETPPDQLKLLTQKDILLSFRGKRILLKFLFYQFLGALFSLSVCPQFGLGLVEGHGITHVFRLMGDWACAAFCGVVFLLSGAFVASLGMKGEEIWWVWRRHKVSLFFLPALMWALLMFFNISLELPGEIPSYHVIWILTAIATQVFWLQVRGKIYAQTSLKT